MKFKVGDKVIPRKFSSQNDKGVGYLSLMDRLVGKKCEITKLYNFGYQINNEWTWIESALEPIESEQYFYVGQTVYSPLFKNKERSGKVIQINHGDNFQVLCESSNNMFCFTLDGRYDANDEFPSLFQEPIQFPVNKPIETFEEGEIVEYSNDGVHWGLGYFAGLDDNKEYPYRVCILKGMHDKLDSYSVWSKVKKFKK